MFSIAALDLLSPEFCECSIWPPLQIPCVGIAVTSIRRDVHVTDKYVHGILGLGPSNEYCTSGGSCRPMHAMTAIARQHGLPNMVCRGFGAVERGCDSEARGVLNAWD